MRRSETERDVAFMNSYIPWIRQIALGDSGDSALAEKCRRFTVNMMGRYYTNFNSRVLNMIIPSNYDVYQYRHCLTDTAASALIDFTPSELSRALRKRYLTKRVLQIADKMMKKEGFVPAYEELRRLVKS